MAHYKREGCGAETENIKAMLHERRLLVSFDEYQEMLSNTKYAEATHNSVLPEDFWKTDVMYSITTCTTVHCNDEGDDDDDDHYSIQVEDLFLGDGLSEEVCLTQGDEADDNSGGARRRQIHSVDYSSNLYESMKSVFTIVCQNAEITGDARIEALARRHMNEFCKGSTR